MFLAVPDYSYFLTICGVLILQLRTIRNVSIICSFNGKKKELQINNATCSLSYNNMVLIEIIDLYLLGCDDVD
jgi:hypothetical protein